MADTISKCEGPKAGKHNKPLLERQRRARINKSLDQIKDLILSTLYKDDPITFAEKRKERMDKAEILEFAVDYIKNQQYGARTTSPPKPHDQSIVHPRLHFMNAASSPFTPCSIYPAANCLEIGPTQPWMNFVRSRCIERCCSPFYGNVKSISSPPCHLNKDGGEKAKETTTFKESLEYSNSVWRPW